MKKILLSIGAGLLIGFGTMAQTPQLVERDGWSVLDATTNHQVITGFTKANGLTNIYAGNSNAGSYNVTWNGAGDVMRIDYTHKSSAYPNWETVNLNLLQLDDSGDANRTEQFYSYTTPAAPGTKIVQAAKAMTARGNIIDFSNPNNAYISFQYRTPGYSGNFNMSFELCDILGRYSNGYSSSINADNFMGTETWRYVLLSWNGLNDMYPDFAAEYDAQLDKDGKILMTDMFSGFWGSPKYPNPWIFEAKPLVSDKIAEIVIRLFTGDANKTMGRNISIEFKNLTVGNPEATPFIWRGGENLEVLSNDISLGVVNVEKISSSSTKLTAIAGAGALFEGWSDGNLENPRTVNPLNYTEPTTLIANFANAKNLQAENANLKNENSNLQTQLNTANETIAGLEEQLTNCGDADLQATITQLKQEKATLLIEIKNLQTLLNNCEGTSIRSLEVANVQIYPNPTAGIVNISTASEIKLYSLQGALLYETFGTQVDLSAYPKGVYQLHINGDVVRVVRK